MANERKMIDKTNQQSITNKFSIHSIPSKTALQNKALFSEINEEKAPKFVHTTSVNTVPIILNVELKKKEEAINTSTPQSENNSSKIRKIVDTAISFVSGGAVGFALGYTWFNHAYVGAQISTIAIFGAASVAMTYLKMEKFKKGFAKGAVIGAILIGAVTSISPAYTSLGAFIVGTINGVIDQVRKSKD